MKKLLFALFMSGLSAAAHCQDAHAAGKAVHPEPMTQHWSAPAKAAKRRNPVPADAASIERGRVLYRAHCAACHGDDGTGRELDPRPANLREMAHHHPDGDLAWKIANGRGGMPAWKGVLKQRQIWDLVNFLNTFE